MYNRLLGKNFYSESPHCYPFTLRDRKKRDDMLVLLSKNNIEARKLFSCLPTQEKAYTTKHVLGDFPCAESIGEKDLFLPIHQNLTEADIKKICRILLTYEA